MTSLWAGNRLSPVKNLRSCDKYHLTGQLTGCTIYTFVLQIVRNILCLGAGAALPLGIVLDDTDLI